MRRVVTLNLNGIRSAARKGFFEWLGDQQADIVCVQELKAQAGDMTPEMLAPAGYRGYFNYAERPGYSGVGIYSRIEPDRVGIGIGVPDLDAEGRYLELVFGALRVVSLYLPSGSSSPERLAVKFRFMREFLPRLRALASDGLETVICGDWNIAHREIDLRNWRGNLQSPGFLPEERAWLSRLFDEFGFVDVFRRLDPSPDRYTWWSNRGAAWDKNVGWRIDYQIATPGVAARAWRTSIHLASRFSDHAPLTIDYEPSDGR
jgi:exodeoxyribonuclease III